MDMQRYLKRWLTIPPLEAMGDVYDGTILAVNEPVLRNRFTTERERMPVITFRDGWLLGLNLGMRRHLVATWGSETDVWLGRRLRVFLRPMSRRDPDDDRPVRYEKAVECLDVVEPDEADAQSLARLGNGDDFSSILSLLDDAG